MQRHDLESVVQILAERALLHHPLEVLIRRRDDAQVDRDVLGAADATERAALEHTQQLDLQHGRHLADLVEEQRATVRHLHETQLLGAGIGERALLVTEQLRLEQFGGDRGAVDLDERLGVASAHAMHEVREVLLARAALALDEHAGGVAARDLLGDRVRLLHRRRRRVQELMIAERLMAQATQLEHELLRLERTLGEREQLLLLERLLHEPVRPGAHRLDGRLEFAERGHEHHRDLGLQALDLAQQVEPAAVGQLEVEEREVRHVAFDRRTRLADGVHAADDMPVVLERTDHEVADRVLVLDDEDVGLVHRAPPWVPLGNSTVKVAP